MNQQLVFTVIAQDKPGIVTTIADLVNQHGGNWLDSRMSQLAGEFAGIVHIEIPLEKRSSLESALVALAAEDMIVMVKSSGESKNSDDKQINIEVLGNDRTGIVAEITKLFSKKDINIVEFDTSVNEAPVAGGMLFHADALISVAADVDLESLQDKLHDIADELTLDIEWTSKL